MTLRKSFFSRRRMLFLLALMLLFCASGPRLMAQSREYQLKAAFLFNFAQFTDFSTNAFPSTNAPMVIAVLGENPFGNTLHELVKGEKVAGRPVEVRLCRRIGEIEGAGIVFVAQSAWSAWEQVAKAVAGKPVLTISEMDQFTGRGGMIRLFAAGNKIQFNINPAAARAAGLSFSSKLLRLATIVREEAPSE